MLSRISTPIAVLFSRRPKAGNIQALNQIFQDHGMDTQTDGNKLFVLDHIFYPGGRCLSYWIDATSWNIKQAKFFLGY